jgi:hypothetical protein
MSKSLIGKVDEALLGNNVNIKLIFNESEYIVRKIKFKKNNCLLLTFKCDLLFGENLAFNAIDNKNLKLKFITNNKNILNYKILSLKHILDDDNTDKYIIKIILKIEE